VERANDTLSPTWRLTQELVNDVFYLEARSRREGWGKVGAVMLEETLGVLASVQASRDSEEAEPSAALHRAAERLESIPMLAVIAERNGCLKPAEVAGLRFQVVELRTALAESLPVEQGRGEVDWQPIPPAQVPGAGRWSGRFEGERRRLTAR